MAANPQAPPDLSFHTLTPERWADLERLFGERGACGGCWCMWWRIPRKEFEKQKGEQNRQAFHRIVDSGTIPGVLAYDGDDPIGWCAVEPRENYPVLARSRTLKPVDDEPVWSVTCFFIARPYRKRGVSVLLLNAAAEYVRSRGGRILEGYPTVPRDNRMPDAFAWTGPLNSFLQAGFVEVARPSPSRRIVRNHLK